MVDTPIQKRAQEYIETECKDYNNITVTGHSKGGNLAQYVTVKCGDKIERCISYDGQGFNKEFISQNSDAISKNKGKIKSISANDDYVNILLTSIAGESVYLKYKFAKNPHSAYALYEKNKGTCTDIYTNQVEQSAALKLADKVLDDFVDEIGGLPEYLEEPLIDALGSAVGTWMANNSGQLTEGDIIALIIDIIFAIDGMKEYIEEKGLDWESIKEKISNNIQGKIANFRDTFNYVAQIGDVNHADFFIDYARTKFELERLQRVYTSLEKQEARLLALKDNNEAIRKIRPTLNIIQDDIQQNKKKIGEFYQVLEQIIKFYESVEQRITNTAVTSLNN